MHHLEPKQKPAKNVLKAEFGKPFPLHQPQPRLPKAIQCLPITPNRFPGNLSSTRNAKGHLKVGMPFGSFIWRNLTEAATPSFPKDQNKQQKGKETCHKTSTIQKLMGTLPHLLPLQTPTVPVTQLLRQRPQPHPQIRATVRQIHLILVAEGRSVNGLVGQVS